MSNIVKKEENTNEILTPIGLDEFKQHFENFQKFVTSQLKEGINDDYGLIPGTKKKTLFKSGAEKLANFFGLYAEPELIDKEIDWQKPFFYFAYKYIVYSIKTGRIVAVGEGSANSRESKFKRANMYDMENVVRKIAMKRAFVSAILSATRGSFMFTQDMEDYIDIADGEVNKNNLQKEEEIQKEDKPKDAITNKQWKFLYAKLSQNGFNIKSEKDKELIASYISKFYGINIKNITWQILQQFIEELDNGLDKVLMAEKLKPIIKNNDNPFES